MPGDHRAVDPREPDGLGFSDQIADREQQTVLADEHGIASAVGTEDRSRKGVLRNLGAQSYDRPEHLVQIERQLLRSWLKLLRKDPVAHRRSSHPARIDILRSIQRRTASFPRLRWKCCARTSTSLRNRTGSIGGSN